MLDIMGRRWAAVIVRNEALYLGIQHLDRCAAAKGGHDMQSLLWVSNRLDSSEDDDTKSSSAVSLHTALSLVIDGYDYDYCCAFDVFAPDETRDRQIRLNLPRRTASGGKPQPLFAM